MSVGSVDRGVVRGMIEDFWRSYVLFMRDLQVTHPRASLEDLQGQCLEFSRRQWQQFEAMAASMAPEQARDFMEMIDEEDILCSQEHHFHPERFCNRLGLSQPANIPSAGERDTFYRRHGLDPDAVHAFIASQNAMPTPTALLRAPAPAYRRQGLSELAFRTALRATIWESIRSLFRR